MKPSVIIIAGPTASGKSDYAENLAREIDGEIVNADAVQMFTRLSVGTAKPDWQSSEIVHHLFDICDQPRDFDVSQYRQVVAQSVCDILNRSRSAILVGGSLFYIKSLFYPPKNALKVGKSRETLFEDLSNQQLWDELFSIDEVRANELHPNDRYRVERALRIWQATGKKPSEHKPVYDPLFNDVDIRFLCPPLTVLYDRINRRTITMITDMGWIDEARDAYYDNTWRDFIITKNFIGYPELFSWIAAGEKKEDLPAVITRIQELTRQYAKRQRTFWRSFCEQVSHDSQNHTSKGALLVTAL